VSTDEDDRGELQRRLDDARARVEVLHDALERADHEMRIRMTRHVEAVDELLPDLEARATRLPPPHTADRRQFDRDLSALEDEIAFTEDRFGAARAEERGDARAEARADARALADSASALWSEIAPVPPRDEAGADRGPADPPDRGAST
jgi:hypothetical protein